jgi:hypothetical protein
MQSVRNQLQHSTAIPFYDIDKATGRSFLQTIQNATGEDAANKVGKQISEVGIYISDERRKASWSVGERPTILSCKALHSDHQVTNNVLLLVTDGEDIADMNGDGMGLVAAKL